MHCLQILLELGPCLKGDGESSARNLLTALQVPQLADPFPPVPQPIHPLRQRRREGPRRASGRPPF